MSNYYTASCNSYPPYSSIILFTIPVFCIMSYFISPYVIIPQYIALFTSYSQLPFKEIKTILFYISLDMYPTLIIPFC